MGLQHQREASGDRGPEIGHLDASLTSDFGPGNQSVQDELHASLDAPGGLDDVLALLAGEPPGAGTRIAKALLADPSGGLIDGLLAAQALEGVFALLRTTDEGRERLLQGLPKLMLGAERAARTIDAMLEDDAGDAHRLAAFWIFDEGRAQGWLDACLLRLAELRPQDPVAARLIRHAKPKVLPETIVHRGTFGSDAPENTMAGLEKVVGLHGFRNVEIDLSFTADGHIVLWHDAKRTDFVAWVIRESQLEPGMTYAPVWGSDQAPKKSPLDEMRSAQDQMSGFDPWGMDPWGLDSPFPQEFQDPTEGMDLRPVHERGVLEVREDLGYRKKWAEKVPDKVPTFEEICTFAAKYPDLKLSLDIKVPADSQKNVAFAKQMEKDLDQAGIDPSRIFVMSTDDNQVRLFRSVWGDKYDISRDVEMVAVIHSPTSTLPYKDALKTQSVSVGMPRAGIGGYDAYLETLEGDRQEIDRRGDDTKIIAWTLNDELSMREVMGESVDGMVTDEPLLLEKVKRKYELPAH